MKSKIRYRYYAEIEKGKSMAEAAAIANQIFAADSPDDGLPADDEMREAIKEATGKAPHGKLGRDKLIEQYQALDSEAL